MSTVDIPASGTISHAIRLERWSDLPRQGWYSADDHLHIPRPTSELNPAISKMMQAEDIHVANLLQMGKVEDFARRGYVGLQNHDDDSPVYFRNIFVKELPSSAGRFNTERTPGSCRLMTGAVES